MAHGLINSSTSFGVLRFLLGVSEAGLAFGVIYYISLWYPAKHRGKSLAIFLSFSVIAGIIMGPFSGWLMEATHGFSGVAGWRWMFILEGLPSVILVIVTVFYLTDRIKDANWLTDEEKTWLESTLEAERRAQPPVEHHSVMPFLKDKGLMVMVGVYFWWSIGNNAIMIWLPTILKSSSSATNQTIGFLYGLFFVCAFIGLYATVWLSRRTGDRKTILVLCCWGAFVTMAISAFSPSALLAYITYCVAAFCIWGFLPVFWTVPSEYLGGVSAAVGIALINSMSGIGGLIGPSMISIVRDATGKFSTAVFLLALVFLVQGFFIIAMRVKKRATEGKTEALAAQAGN